MSEDPSKMAMSLMEAVAEFARSGSAFPNLVRVVIFQKDMFHTYLSKMEEVSRDKPTMWGKLKKLTGL